MSKYRIIQSSDGKYYPQKKLFTGWQHISCYGFTSLEHAERHIDKYDSVADYKPKFIV